ncbi:hypothetical protein Ait01nite_054630 [Actinoplanes italicus]|uniref:Uncharacterized protein n=1 Tax=Actinoplanes italicus TaxID=113567 RepID=A0A2T0K7K9_9ACTN|nr:hypothetical protein [Actinoplanes italicus]PRX19003.1 hypothetical protein CLV67_111151 [Actinoplanes italicus]GIE32418.1 hypothetical protein Ait01nite_054630 [Actinoplanes italicus]
MVVTTRGSEPDSPHKRPAGTVRPERGTRPRGDLPGKPDQARLPGKPGRSGLPGKPGRSGLRGRLPDPAALDVKAALLDLRATTSRHRITAAGLRTASTAIRVVTATRSPVGSSRPRRKALFLGLAVAAAGLGVVVVSTTGQSSGSAEFRSPPAVPAQASAAGPSAAAKQGGLAPYARASVAGPRLVPDTRMPVRAGRNGSAAPEPSATARRTRVLPGQSARPAKRATARTATRTGAGTRARSGLTEKAASISIGEPGGGATVSGPVSVSGTVDMPEGYQVWLLSRQGATGSYQVEGACRGQRAFVCGSAGLAGGGDDTFEFTTVVVDSATAATLHAGATRDSLPTYVARSEVTIRRAAA